MVSIEVEFDIYKDLTMLRPSENVTFSDVIRGLLGSKHGEDPVKTQTQIQLSGWYAKGVTFPNGTEFRATYKNRLHLAHVNDGALVLGLRKYYSPSAAATAVTGTNVNGWGFWQCRMPGRTDWVDIWTLRNQ
jgi:hypothetical protein